MHASLAVRGMRVWNPKRTGSLIDHPKTRGNEPEPSSRDTATRVYGRGSHADGSEHLGNHRTPDPSQWANRDREWPPLAGSK